MKKRKTHWRKRNLGDIRAWLRCKVPAVSFRISGRRRNTEGAELVEFALALPLILVMLVGLLDFAHAYHLKQALANAARAGARLGGTETVQDLTNPTCGAGGSMPCSIDNIKNEVISYLQNAGINTSFIGTTGTYNTTTLTATYYTTAGTNSYGLEINRNFIVVDSSGTSIPSTQVILTYPYDWTFGFNYVVKLLVPSATFAGPITIETDATMANP